MWVPGHPKEEIGDNKPEKESKEKEEHGQYGHRPIQHDAAFGVVRSSWYLLARFALMNYFIGIYYISIY